MPNRETLGGDVIRRMQMEHEQEVVARMVPRQRIPEALFVSADEAAGGKPRTGIEGDRMDEIDDALARNETERQRLIHGRTMRHVDDLWAQGDRVQALCWMRTPFNRDALTAYAVERGLSSAEAEELVRSLPRDSS